MSEQYRGVSPQDGESAQEFFDRTYRDRSVLSEQERRENPSLVEHDMGMAAVMAEAEKGKGPEAPLHEQGADQAVALERDAIELARKLERDGLEEEGPDTSDVEQMERRARMLRKNGGVRADRAARVYQEERRRV